MTALSWSVLVVGAALTVLLLAFGVCRLIGVRLPVPRTLAAGIVALLVASPIITAMIDGATVASRPRPGGRPAGTVISVGSFAFPESVLLAGSFAPSPRSDRRSFCCAGASGGSLWRPRCSASSPP